ncbi:AfsR/SARP family transcriptional regulator [Streptomyces albofaciens JCM 4342]|uniref:BTAD domain-containing putative transcriptional regulator n=1 Tax=Streptomyces albofaciens TaxID=66866 RepID=UPI00123B4F64|nr:BTAD domain-containing putative transcriptional regulator [Streptomyces albofaciens]KAA6215305.1 AfsR/SARP family transcriptional regulator [Streptomyces albofaciens JCM 4342]
MRFGVLGPVEVWAADGRPVRVPERKVRALLAALLAHQGRPVGTARLIDALWDERLPTNPAGALQAKVSQLRRALETAGPGGRALVAARPPGYQLDVAADAVDAGRFAALTARAYGSPDPGERAALLTEALGLWRGPAFAGCGDAPFVRAAAGRLEEQRLTALEEQAAARLELGEHGPLAGELAELVARHPLRERLCALHLRALYGTGRQGEALAAYAALRERLAEELGVDPGPELTALHQAMLEQDPGLAGGSRGEQEAERRPPARTATGARPAASPRTNLPTALTGLVGRDAAVRDVRALLEAGRLVTLTGPGGVGKTRLALEAAQRLADDPAGFPDGVLLVELAALGRPGGAEGGRTAARTAAELAEAVLAVLGVREGAASGPAVERLAGAVRDKRLLLLLDNCEHVVDAVAEVTAKLLAAAPGLRVLATSQELLGLAGERVRPVPPLDQADAVALFAARAAATAPGFTLDARDAPGRSNAAAVADICRRLDGIPLALELAATRVRALGVRELSARLDDRFRLLSAGRRGAPPRQQTLRAMIDWSWELLTEDERAVLRRLAVHADGCTLRAAEEVCAGGGVRSGEVAALLARLVDRSLVVVAESPYGPRYRLLESVAAYCLEQLREAGEWEAVRRRHSVHHTSLAERAEPFLYGEGQREWLARLDAETANLRMALDSAVQEGAAERALRLVNALCWYWFLRGRLGEAGRALAMALDAAASSSVPDGLRLRAMVWQVGMASLAGSDTDPVARADAVLKQYGDEPDHGAESRAGDGSSPDHAWALWFLTYAQVGLGDPAVARERLSRALAAFRTLGDRWGTAAVLSSRAQGQYAAPGAAREGTAARLRDAEESAALFRELGDRWGQLQAAEVLGTLAEISGDYERAARLHRDGLRGAEELGLWIQASYKHSGLGRIALLTGDLEAARAHHERGLRLAAEQSHRRGEMFAETGLGIGARRAGRLDDAERHHARWLEWCRSRDGDPGTALILAELGFTAELRGDAEAARRRHLDGYEAARATGDPRAVALALEGLAGARSLAGHCAHAARLLGHATATRAAVGTPLPPAERWDVDRITARTREGLGSDTAFTTAFEEGTTMSAEELVREAGGGA